MDYNDLLKEKKGDYILKSEVHPNLITSPLCLQIKAYLLCSKLRPAYLLAVKLDPSRAGPLVQDVLQAAEGAQDSVMQNICRQWLSEHHNKSSQPRQGRTNAR